MQNTLKKIEFILELEKLKAVLRKNKPIGLNRYENSAEHSWHVSLLVMILAEDANRKIDTHKVMKMMLLHDIVEIDAGDVLVYDTTGKKEVQEKEIKAAKCIFGLLPENLEKEFTNIWEEFESEKTIESKFAKALDRIIPVLQNLNNNGQSWIENSVSLEQVLNKNKVIQNASPLLWKHIKEKLENATFWN